MPLRLSRQSGDGIQTARYFSSTLCSFSTTVYWNFATAVELVRMGVLSFIVFLAPSSPSSMDFER